MSASMHAQISSRELSQLQRFVAVLNRYRIRREHHRAARTLAGLNDYMLKDMGVGRSEIQSVVYGRSVGWDDREIA